MLEPRELSVTEAIVQMGKGRLKARDLVESCLERIHLRENSIHAWVDVFEEQVIKEADECDEVFVQTGKLKGPLHGIPVGIKDIIDVKGMLTRAGTAAYPQRLAEFDSPAVKQMRDAGAVILGKTETTAFANDDPADTRNPWNTEHTPGGSSSGSAAAVADRMCLAALGTQTGGSVLRPAAYNGVVGFKPTIAYISTKDVVPVSWTLDHVGIFTRSIEDAGVLFDVCRDMHPDPFAHTYVYPQSYKTQLKEQPFRFGFFPDFVKKEASPAVAEHLDSVKKLFRNAGAEIVDIDFPANVSNDLYIIFCTEQASHHREVFGTRKDKYPPKVKARIESGLKTMGYEYIDAIRKRVVFQDEFFNVLSALDGILLPTAPTTAPEGLSSTGSPVFCEPFSFAGFPSISIPSGLDNQGLPLAIQLGSNPGDEKNLLAVAAWCEDVLSFNSSPS